MKRLVRAAGILAGIGAAIWLMKDRFLQVPDRGDGEISPFRVPSSDGNGAKAPTKLMEAAPAPGTETGEGDDLTEIKGIGPVYSQRLVAYGVATFGALAAADATEIAEHLSVPPDQVESWIEQASHKG